MGAALDSSSRSRGSRAHLVRVGVGVGVGVGVRIGVGVRVSRSLGAPGCTWLGFELGGGGGGRVELQGAPAVADGVAIAPHATVAGEATPPVQHLVRGRECGVGVRELRAWGLSAASNEAELDWDNATARP